MAQANSSIATAPSCSTLLRKPLKLEELGKWIQSGALEYLPSPTFSKGRTQAFGWSRKGTRLGTAPRIEERIIRLTLQSGPMLIALKHCWGPQDLGTLPVVAASPDFQAWLSRIINIILYKYIDVCLCAKWRLCKHWVLDAPKQAAFMAGSGWVESNSTSCPIWWLKDVN